MKNDKIISFICGLGILITMIIMNINVRDVAYNFSKNEQIYSLSIKNAVQFTTIKYSIFIGIFVIISVLVNILKKQNKK